MDETHVRRVMDAIDADRLVDLASRLIALPSLSGDEAAGQDAMAGLLRDAGLAVDVWDTPTAALSDSPWYSAEVDRDVIRCVIGTLGGRSALAEAASGTTSWSAAEPARAPALLLNGHIDVVPAGDPGDWTVPPFAPDVRDGRLFGRGACDMKGGLAAALHALEALAAAGVRLDGPVTVASVVGEEDGGCGTLALLEHGVPADGCVIMEPTACSVVPAVAGALSWRIRVRGLSAHGCLREEGVSALELFPGVHRAVLELERWRNARAADPLFAWLDRPFAICGGRISGGDWPSSEMDWLLWEGRYGVAPGEDLAAARAEFEGAVAIAADRDPWLRDHPPTVEWWGGQFYPGRTDGDARIVSAVRAAATTVTGSTPVVRGMPYGCDLGLTTNVAGIPTVVYGPGDVRDAHRPDESVPITDLVTVARTIALTAMRFCDVDGA